MSGRGVIELLKGLSTIGGVIVAAGGVTLSRGTLNFEDSNGVSFGLDTNGNITASVSPSGGGSYNILAAGTQTANTTGTVAFVNSNGISFGMSNNSQITASYTVPTQTNQTVGIYATGNTTGTSSGTFDARSLSINGAGNITVGISNGQLYISQTGAGGQSNQTLGIYAVSNTTLSSSGTLDARSLSFEGAGAVSIGVSNGSVQISAPNTIAQTVQTQNVVVPTAGTQTATSGTVAFANSNGITFGMSGSSQITASVRTDYQSSGAYLTTAALSQDSSKYAGTNGAITGGSITVNTSGISINLPAYLTTADLSQNSSKYAGTNGAITNGSITVNTSGVSVNIPVQTNQTIGVYGISNTTGQSSSSTIDARSLSFEGAGGVSVGMSGGSVIISGAAAVVGGALAISAGTNSTSVGTVVLSNSNGISFGMNIAGIVTASYSVPSIAGLISAINVSAGTASNNLTAVTFNNSNGVSFGLNGSVVTATVATNYQSQGAYLTTAALSQDSSKYAGTNGAITGGSITVNTSGVSINLPAYLTTADLSQNSSKYAGTNGAITNGSITVNTSGVSVNVPVQTNQTEGWYALGNTTAQSSSGTVDARSISISGAGAISVGLSAGQFVISGPNVAAGNVTFSAGANSAGLASLVFSNSNGVSFGLNGSTITASVAAGGGAGFSAGVSNLGNTSGNTGTVSNQLILAGTNNIYLSQNIGAGGATVSIDAIPMKRAVYPDNQFSAISAPGMGSMSIQYFPNRYNLSATRFDIVANHTGASNLTTYLYSSTLLVGIYTNNAGTLSLLSSGSLTNTFGWTWTSGSFSSITGIRLLSCPITVNMTPGDYFVMANFSSDGAQSFGAGTTRSSVMTMTMYGGTALASANAVADFGVGVPGSSNIYSGAGIYSVTSNAIPSTIALTGINATATNLQRANIVIQFRG